MQEKQPVLQEKQPVLQEKFPAFPKIRCINHTIKFCLWLTYFFDMLTFGFEKKTGDESPEIFLSPRRFSIWRDKICRRKNFSVEYVFGVVFGAGVVLFRCSSNPFENVGVVPVFGVSDAVNFGKHRS